MYKNKKFIIIFLIALSIPLVYKFSGYFSFFRPGITTEYSANSEVEIKKLFGNNGCYEVGLWARDKRFNNHLTNGKFELSFYSNDKLVEKRTFTNKSQAAYSMKTGSSSFIALQTFQIPIKKKYRDLSLKLKTLKADSLAKDDVYLYLKKSKYACGKAKKLSNRSKDNNYITKVETNATLLPLYKALRTKDTQKVITLIKSGISPNVEIFAGKNPIHFSAYYDDAKTMQYLIDKKVDLNKKDVIEKTPLHYAIENNATKTLKLLLDSGADLNLVETVDTQYYGGGYGQSFHTHGLNYYVTEGNLLTMTKILLEHGMDINKHPYKRHQTPFDCIKTDMKNYDYYLTQKNLDFKPKNYRRMIELTRLYGAKTYAELQKENNITNPTVK